VDDIKKERNRRGRMKIENVDVTRTEKLLVWTSLKAEIVDGVC
jgi:hypothetical protein